MHITEPDRGIYDAWNKGVRAARGEWIMFVGADDKLLNGAIDCYFKKIISLRNKTVDFISGKIKSIKQDGSFLQYTGRLWNYSRCRINMDVIHVASLTNREYFKRIGLFNIDYKICGDYDLLMRGGKGLRAEYVDYPIAEMPIGGASFSVKALKEQFLIKHRTGKVSIPICCLVFLAQLVLFYTYIIRHSYKL